jgi:hypothetical protein
VFNHVHNIKNKKAWTTSTNGWGALKCNIDGTMTSLTKLCKKFLEERFPDCDIGMRASAGPFSCMCLSWGLCQVLFTGSGARNNDPWGHGAKQGEAPWHSGICVV